MINLQNPTIPVQQNAIEIDRAIMSINDELGANIDWITHNYGRAYKKLDVQDGRRLYFPHVYLGQVKKDYRYFKATPDNDKKGQCFFVVRREDIVEYENYSYNFMTYDVGIVFSVNLKLINESLVSTDYFIQNCIAEVRNFITRIYRAQGFRIQLSSTDYLFEDIYREFDISKDKQIEKSPLAHFRLNATITLQEECLDYNPIRPLPTTDLFLHLDASESVNGGTPNDGDSVFMWDDVTTNNNDFLQGQASRQPTYVENGINTRPAIRFSSSYLEATGVSIPSIPEFSIWCVCRKEDVPLGGLGNVFTLFMNGYGSSTSRFIRLSESFFSATNYSTDTGVASLNATLAPNTIGIDYVFGMVKSVTGIDYYVNGALVASTTGAHSPTGAYMSIGSWNNAFFRGLVSEFVIYSKVNTATEILAVNNYFSDKYGV